MPEHLYIGLMSGSSLDAIDAAACHFSYSGKMSLVETHSHPIPNKLKQEILTLCWPGHNAIERMGKTDTQLGTLFGECCLTLLDKAGIASSAVDAIGSHGQTIRHRPYADFPFTVQIGNPNIIAAMTHITTIADFRRRDLALGGQAAPLAPGFHQYAFQSREKDRVIINIGGIANLTHLPKDQNEKVCGFDTGPGNTLIDSWCKQHLQRDFDDKGQWAASGNIDQPLLQRILEDEFFSRAGPKSTGRELFNLEWLSQYLNANHRPQDVQSTLTELTAKSIAHSVKSVCKDLSAEIYVCGGGTHNHYLIQRISYLLNHPVNSTEKLGINPDWVEAATFAWLAYRTKHYQTGSLPSVTGAQSAAILGAIYPVTPH